MIIRCSSCSFVAAIPTRGIRHAVVPNSPPSATQVETFASNSSKRVGAGCEDVLLMRLSGLLSQRIKEDVHERPYRLVQERPQPQRQARAAAAAAAAGERDRGDRPGPYPTGPGRDPPSLPGAPPPARASP